MADQAIVDDFLNPESYGYGELLSVTNVESTAIEYVKIGCIPVIIEAMMKFKDETDSELQRHHLYALYCLFNLSKFDSTRDDLKANPDLLPACEMMMQHSSQMVALIANFIVCLVAGRDEAGVGADLIRRSPRIISDTIDLLNKVLDTGRGFPVYGAVWDPDEIVIVLLSLSVSDANKPLLSSAIPVLIKCLKKRPDNTQMVSDVVQTLLQLSFEKITQAQLITSASEIEGYLAKCTKGEGVQNAINSLLSRLKPQERKTSEVALKGSKLAGLFRSAMGSSAKGGASAAAAAPAPAKSGQLQILISYNWKHQATVKKINSHLSSKGFKVWIDLEQMSGNIADRMAEAVESSDIVLMCISPNYKESVNCRQEAEYAHECKKPIVVLMMEKGYKANGWLGLMIGRKLWVDCTDENTIDIPGIDREISEIAKTLGVSAPTQTGAITNASSGAAHGKDISPASPTSVSTTSQSGSSNDGALNVSNASLTKIRAMTVADVSNWLKSKGFNDQVSYFEKESMNGKALSGLFIAIKTGGIDKQITLFESRLGLNSLGLVYSFIDELAILHQG